MFKGIKNKILFVIGVTIFLRLFVNLFVMSYFGDRLIVKETSRAVQSVGKNVVSEIESRISGFEAIGNSIGVLYPQFNTGDQKALNDSLPLLLDNNHDVRVSGGGVWDISNIENSFYWERDNKSHMVPVNVGTQKANVYFTEQCKPFQNAIPKGSYFWNTLHFNLKDEKIVSTAIRKLYDKAGKFKSMLSMDVRLEGLRSNVEYWERELGSGYIFIVDQSNQFVTFPEGKKSYKGKIPVKADSLAEVNSEFNEIFQGLKEMDKSLIRRAMEMPGYSPDVAKHLLYDHPTLGKNYIDTVSAILMNPIVNETFYKKFSLDNDFLLNESAQAYAYFIPKTYWKLILVVPDSFEGAAMAKLERIFHAIWIIAIIFSFSAGSWIIKKIVIKPLNTSTTHIEATIDAFKNENWKTLESIRKEAKGTDEIEVLVKEFNSFIGKILTYQESVEYDQKESASESSKSLKEKDKILDRFNEIEIENKELKEMLQSDIPLIDKKEKEYSTSMKAHQQELLNVMKSVKGLRVSVLKIWEGVLLIPDVTPLIAEESREEFNRILGLLKNSDADHVVISLEGLLLENSADLLSLINEVNQAISLIGLEVLFVDIPVTIASEIARTEKGQRISSYSNISQSLFAVWEKRDNDIRNRPTA